MEKGVRGVIRCGHYEGLAQQPLRCRRDWTRGNWPSKHWLYSPLILLLYNGPFLHLHAHTYHLNVQHVLRGASFYRPGRALYPKTHHGSPIVRKLLQRAISCKDLIEQNVTVLTLQLAWVLMRYQRIWPTISSIRLIEIRYRKIATIDISKFSVNLMSHNNCIQ